MKGSKRPRTFAGARGVLGVFVVLGVVVGLTLVQRQETVTLGAERELRRSEAAEAKQLREVIARLRAAQPDAAALAALQAERIELARLRVELDALERAARSPAP